MSGALRGPEGCIDGLHDGVMFGWALDPEDPDLVVPIRVMRGGTLLAEGRAAEPRADGRPGFQIRLPRSVRPEDLLEGRVRVRAFLPGHQAAATLALTDQLRASLAGGGPASAMARTMEQRPPPAPARPRQPAPPPIPAQPGAAPAPPAATPAEVPPALRRVLPLRPRPAHSPTAAETPAAPEREVRPPLGPPAPPASAAAVAGPQRAGPAASPQPAAMQSLPVPQLSALAAAVEGKGITLLHLLLPGPDAARADAPPGIRALETAVAAAPRLAADAMPLRHVFAAAPVPAALWRPHGRALSAAGGLLLLRCLLAATRARLPGAAAALAQAEAALARIGPATLSGGAPGEATAPGLPPPRRLAERPGLEAWSSPGAPLPWRVLLLTQPGLGGSADPAAPGWWLSRLATECVISDALETAAPEAALALRPDLILTLLAEP